MPQAYPPQRGSVQRGRWSLRRAGPPRQPEEALRPIDPHDSGGDEIAYARVIARVLEPLGRVPKVNNHQQALHAFRQLAECAELADIFDAPRHDSADGVPVGEGVKREWVIGLHSSSHSKASHAASRHPPDAPSLPAATRDCLDSSISRWMFCHQHPHSANPDHGGSIHSKGRNRGSSDG